MSANSTYDPKDYPEGYVEGVVERFIQLSKEGNGYFYFEGDEFYQEVGGIAEWDPRNHYVMKELVSLGYISIVEQEYVDDGFTAYRLRDEKLDKYFEERRKPVSLLYFDEHDRLWVNSIIYREMKYEKRTTRFFQRLFSKEVVTLKDFKEIEPTTTELAYFIKNEFRDYPILMKHFPERSTNTVRLRRALYRNDFTDEELEQLNQTLSDLKNKA